MLEQFIVAQVFNYILIFSRVGAGLMVLPGYGETYVSTGIRLNFALLISLVLLPVLGRLMPPLPDSVIALALLVAAEIMVGIFIGTICRVLISATHVAGTIFSFQSGLSSAVIYDVSESAQGSVVGNFFGIVTIVLLFATGMHAYMLRGITESYGVFAPGQFPPIHDFTEVVTRLMADSFTVAVEISTPMIVIGTLLFLGAGILARLMPSLQIFFLITSPQILVNFFILAATFSAMMLWFMEFFGEKLSLFLGYLK